MSSQYSAIHIPAGCDVYVGDSVDSLENVGVIPMDTDSKIEITYDRSVVQGSKKEEVLVSIRNMKAAASSELYQIRLPIINKLAGGVMSITSVAGSAVSGATHTIASGFEKGRLYILPGQNADGSALSITHIKQGSTTLQSSDYSLAKDASGKYRVTWKSLPSTVLLKRTIFFWMSTTGAPIVTL